VASESPRDWLRRNRGGLAVGVIGMVAVAVAALFLQRPAGPPIVVQPPASPTPVVAARSRPAPSPTAAILVHVGGEVARPGLYQLPFGSRVNDAVTVAGGPSEGGDVQRLNLAARLADGQQVRVPARTERRATAEPGDPTTPARVNINTASLADLDSLPGVGPVTAQRIVAHRTREGPFLSIEQLLEAKLVNAATFERIRELVTV
jgi:competence protein ComEA